MTLKQKVKAILSVWAGVSSFVLLLFIFFVTIPDNQVTLVNTLCTAYITGSILLVYSYYFGDSDTMESETP